MTRAALLLALLASAVPAAPALAQDGADSDGDTIADTSDACLSDHGRGTFSGCPRVRPLLSVQGVRIGNRLRVRRAVITSLPGTRMRVSCVRGHLGFPSGLSGATPAAACRATRYESAGGRTFVRNLTGRTLTPSDTVVVSASRPGSIGAYWLYRVTSGGLSAYERRCTEPDDPATPQPVCDGVGAGVPPSDDDPDGDALAGSADRCPEIHGDGALTGCREMQIDWSFRGTASRGQLRLTQIGFDVFNEARVEVQCSGSTTCPRRAARRRALAGFFPEYRGLLVPPGTVIEVRATAPGAIGRYVRFEARGTRLVARQQCLPPGSRIPQDTCTGRPVEDLPEPLPTPWLSPFPLVEVRGGRFRGGVFVSGVFVRRVPSRSTVRFECSGSGCPRDQSRRTRGGVVRIDGFPRQLQRDIRFVVRVSQPGRIGLYAQIVTGNRWPPIRTERCLHPDLRRPIFCPVRP